MQRLRTLALWLSLCGGVACAEPAATPEGQATSDEDPHGDEASGEPCELPSEPDALLAYLRRGDYKAFAQESGAHASTGPHGGRVLTYINDLLEQSLADENAEHPRCAASVKELFLGNDEVSGWAVLVKTAQASQGGRGYYWFETLGTNAEREPDYAGQGLGICVGCHSTGLDYFRAPWPLQ
jgi:hypothetical protein